MHNTRRQLIFNEQYHDNCHDYLKPRYLEMYAVPKYKDKLYQIARTIPKLNICTDTPEATYIDIVVCDQHAVILSHSKDINPAIATYALNACIGLVLFDPKYKIGALAHIDGLPGYSNQSAIDDGIKIDFDPVQLNLKTILHLFRGLAIKAGAQPNETLAIDCYLVGGIFHLSEVMINDIMNALDVFTDNPSSGYAFTYRGRNLLGPENQSRNICLDTRTGSITHFDYDLNSQIYAKFRRTDGLPINIIKAPHKSEAFVDVTYMPTSN